MQSAVLLVGHGSRDREGTEEFQQLVEVFRQKEPEQLVSGGFLEFAKPTIAESIADCVQRGAKVITVLPGMLTAAGHTKNDIPSEIHDARVLYPEVTFHYGRHLHLHAKLVDLCRVRLEEAENKARPHNRCDTLLLVVGRGSSDPDANSDVHKLSRLLWEGLGYGWAAVGYSGMTTPLLPEALERCHRMGFGRIIVFSFFLFTGVLEKRIRLTVEGFGQQHPGTEMLYANYLNAHELLVDVFRERAHEAIYGNPNMNCDLCKYRVQLPGFAASIGMPQHGHHHHVRGIGQEEHCHPHRHE